MVLILEKLLIKNMFLSKQDQITIAENVNFFLFSLCHLLKMSVSAEETNQS